MSTLIYYFSGTGNSFCIARDIAKDTGAELTAIVSLFDKKTVSTAQDSIGIIFPVYYCSVPLIVKEFAKKWLILKINISLPYAITAARRRFP